MSHGMIRIEIRTRTETRTVYAAPGLTAWDAVQRSGLWPAGDCGGRGICGKCRVKTLDGSRITAQEAELLTEAERNQGIRLACSCRLENDAVMELPENRAGVYKLETTRRRWQGRIASPEAEILGLERPLGVALDIGTTTIAALLVDLTSGEILADRGTANSQGALGRDVMARISYAAENDRGLQMLQSMVLRDIRNLLTGLCDEAGAATEQLAAVTVVGNPVMLHLFMGRSPETLGRSPYQGLFRTAQTIEPAWLGLPAHERGRVWVLPQVGHFLGADIVGCLLALEGSMSDQALVLDIGTNGEMILKTKDRLLGTSAAAGPAFEGAGISCGMTARDGAIDRVWLESGRISFQVLGGGDAAGICGSGLIDLLAVLLELKVLDPTGRINSETMLESIRSTSRGTMFVLTETADGSQIGLTQQDVRELQLAKGALRAGVDTLLEEAGILPEMIEKVFVAGAFGNHLNPVSLLQTGMLPRFELESIINAGNAAVEGALAALLSLSARNRATELAQSIESIQLANRSDFSAVFINSLNF
ncbi:MAG: ASKHA domain-containing protein [Solirubrobacterales bacterium]